MTTALKPALVPTGKKRNLKVHFIGRTFWFLDNGHGEGALAPLDHCDRDGNPTAVRDSFAHVFGDGAVMRFGKQIGTIEDFDVVAINSAAEPASSSRES